MFEIRQAADRGQFNYGWLQTAHTFSFGSYYNLDHMGFRALRVVNEDRVQPGQGFPDHPHRNMEILTYVLDGELEHSDSTGKRQVLHPGDFQRMSAGDGLSHSEANHSPDRELHFMQIWIRPDALDSVPSYQSAHFDAESKRGQLCLIASRDGRLGSLQIQQDVAVYASLLERAQHVALDVAPERYVWVQVARGCVEVNGQKLCQGDGGGLNGYHKIDIQGLEDSEVLVFDLA